MTEEIFITCGRNSDSIDKLHEKTPPSIDNPDRKELLWESRQEELLKQWCDDCKIKSVRHDIHGKRNKIKFIVFAIPSILTPIVLGGVSSFVPGNSLIYSVGMLVSGIFNGIGIFFNFGKKTQLHFEYSNKFSELATDIETELCKPKTHRLACDVYLERTKLQINVLCGQAPNL
jgi:hypothetical protein